MENKDKFVNIMIEFIKNVYNILDGGAIELAKC